MRRAPLLIALVLAMVLAGACSKDKAKREGGDITSAGPISVFELRPGDCLKPDGDVLGEVEKVEAVPCEEPHTHEVFAVPDYPDDDDVYPGESEIQKYADATCLEAFVEYTGTEYLDSNLYFTYLHPSLDSWNDDDRTIVCVLLSPGEEALTGSVQETTTTTVKGATSTSTTAGTSTTTTTTTEE